ncbi:DoxX family protein [Robertkochia solimangrovi]|uniref:DoxX family protein n=1 Tax=Robertkochia solimangrovi TaxID=2213046 RepID=UPI00117FA32B|nr:DoxX family protein [Robertkochia solimangrovi]TRZ46064.1 DoxX family protein [Robertkochia solimangrovi]
MNTVNDIFNGTVMNMNAIFCILLLNMVTFGFSAYEKVNERETTLEWLRARYKSSWILNNLPLILQLILIMEIIVCLSTITGFFSYLLYDSTFLIEISLWGALFCLIILLTGQRLARDYEGARNIVIYLIPEILGLYFLS